MENDKDTLLRKAEIIRDETREELNTAQRVGQMFIDVIQALGSTESTSWTDAFEIVEVNGVKRIKAKMSLYSVGELTAYGADENTPSVFDDLPIASTAVKGIAQFHPDYFNVENGTVSLKDGVGGLDETKLDQYLNSHYYITSSYLLENKYLTESGLSTYLTANKYLTETSLKDKLDLKLDKSVWDEAFEIVETSGVKRIKAKMSLFSVGELTAYGAGDSIPSLWDSLPVASTTSKGIAQFNPAFFTVNAGLVTLRSDLDFGLNESELASYLTSNNYITEAILNNKGYATELFVNQKCTALSTSLTAEIAKKWTTDTAKISAWDKNITDLSSHVADTVKHVTAGERTAWNNKLDKSVWDEAFEVVGIAGNRKIKAKLSLFSVGELTAYMVGDGGDSSLWDSLPVASTTSKGIAQFNPAYFTVNAGLVTLRSDLDFGLNESELTSFLGNNNYAKKTDNVASATKLLNARTIALSGAVTGHGSFDGSGNLTIPTAFAQNFDAKYILKAGDTMSGNLILNDSAATGSRMLKFTGYTDYAHIKFSAASSDNSSLEIATGDNGNTPIYIRQYNTSGEVVRTLTLLDNSGITWFPNKSITQTASTADYGGAIEIRELNKGGALTGDWHEGPRIDLHWGNRVLRSFGVLADGNFHRNGSKIWDAANDGAGSGLDADLLDGRQGTDYFAQYRGIIHSGKLDDFVIRGNGTYAYENPGATQALTVFRLATGSCRTVEILSNYDNTHKIRTVIDDIRYSEWLNLITSGNYGGYVYSKTDADSRFVNVTGDTMTGRLAFNLTSTADTGNAITLKLNNVTKGVFGHDDTRGIYMYNSSGSHYLGILNNGNPHFDTYSLYCESNAGNFYSWSRATRNSYHVWDLSNTTTYNINTYYPVTIILATNEMTRHEIQVSLNSGTKPSWSTHTNGYSVRLVWEENGSGWGTIPIVRKIISATYSFAGQSPIGGITQLTNSSTCVLWLRGGGKYFYYSNGQRTKGGPYTTQQTISQQTFTTLTLDEARQGWKDIVTGWAYSEYFHTGPVNIANEISLRGNTDAGATILFYWNGRNKDIINWTSRLYESASGRLAITGKLAVGAASVNDSYALSATSFYSSGNIYSSGTIMATTGRIYTGYDPGSGYNNSISCSNWFRSNGSTGWFNHTYGGGIYMDNGEWVKVYAGKSFWAAGKIQCDTYFDRKIYTGASWVNGPGAYNVAISNNSAQTPIIVAYRDGYSADVTGANRLFSFEFLNNGTLVNWFFGGASRFEFHSSGNFKAMGNIVATGEVTAYSTSDIRLKKNIRPISNPFNVLNRARPVLFKWNKTAFDLNAERPEGDVPGMIAQWEQSVLPVAIHSVYDKYLGIKYESYIPYLIAGVNEHETEIQSLKKRIRELEQEVEQLKAA